MRDVFKGFTQFEELRDLETAFDGLNVTVAGVAMLHFETLDKIYIAASANVYRYVYHLWLHLGSNHSDAAIVVRKAYTQDKEISFYIKRTDTNIGAQTTAMEHREAFAPQGIFLNDRIRGRLIKEESKIHPNLDERSVKIIKHLGTEKPAVSNQWWTSLRQLS